jgi:hypothetical protein
MRIAIATRWNMYGYHYVVTIDGVAMVARQNSWSWASLVSWSNEWQMTFLDGQELLVRQPVFSPHRTPKWEIILGAGLVCTGRLALQFLPSRSSGLVWTCRNLELSHEKVRKFRMLDCLRTAEGRLIGVWKQRSCRSEGVIRRATSNELTAAMCGIMLLSHVVTL